MNDFIKDVLNGKANEDDIYRHFGATVIPHKRSYQMVRGLTADDTRFHSLLRVLSSISESILFSKYVLPDAQWAISKGKVSKDEPTYCVRFYSQGEDPQLISGSESDDLCRCFMASLIEAWDATP